MENAKATQQQLILPTSIVSPTDIARLLREIQNIDEFFRQSEIRVGGTPNSLPRYSRLLDELVVGNNLNLLQRDHRQWLEAAMTRIKETAPVLHMSFSVDPPGAYVQKIVTWLRENIGPMVLVSVGLQPNIGAGCVVRTTNKAFDFSLRKFFDSKHEFFMEKLHEVLSATEETIKHSSVQSEVVTKEQQQTAENQKPEPVQVSQAQAVTSNTDTNNIEVKSEPAPVNVEAQA